MLRASQAQLRYADRPTISQADSEQRNPDEMKLAIVAYPTLDEVDRQWIESFRTKHDPHASRLGVHFTLVFPVDAVPGELEPDLELAARTIQPIAFELWSTHVVRDLVGSDALIFLVPSVGGPQIEALHDRLYAGVSDPTCVPKSHSFPT